MPLKPPLPLKPTHHDQRREDGQHFHDTVHPQVHIIKISTSGTAMVLELARVMSRYSFRNTIVFSINIGEEQGLYGAGSHRPGAGEYPDHDSRRPDRPGGRPPAIPGGRLYRRTFTEPYEDGNANITASYNHGYGASGICVYTLFIDGLPVQSRKMVFTH